MSGIIDAAIGGLIGDAIAKKLEPKFDELNQTIKTTFVKESANRLLKTRLSKFTSSSSVFTPNSPTGIIDVSNDDELVLTSLSVSPDIDFKTLGRLEIRMNEVEIFQDTSFGDWEDIGILSIELKPQGKIIDRGRKIEFFLWGTGKITVSAQFERRRIEK